MPNPTLAEGDLLPDFSLPSQHGTAIHAADLYKKGPLVLFFYPKDDTLICTQEACGFRDRYTEFTDAGATVVGISSDPVAAHARFASEQNLPYLLLSDADGALRQKLGVPKSLGLLPGRVTYVVDSDGRVRLVYAAALQAQQHVRQALDRVRQLAAGKPGQSAP